MAATTATDAKTPGTGRARKVVKALAIALALMVPASYGGIALFSAHVLTRPKARASQVDPRSVAPGAVPWSTTTDDGLTLRGWYYPTPERRRLVVFVHGLWSHWGHLARQGAELRRRGFDVLLFDLRGHGRSDWARLSMGRNERRDIRAVLAWAKGQGYAPERIGWLAQSMGAATVLMEGVENPEIRAAVLDSPYGDLPELLDAQLSRHSGLPAAFNPGILVAAHHAFGLRSDDLVPARIASRWGERPILLVHGEEDSTVPVRHARAIAEAIGPACSALYFPGTEHCEAFKADPGRYYAAVERYFREHLAP